MKTGLEFLALWIVYPLFVLFIFLFISLNPYAGIPFALFLIAAVVISVKRKKSYMPFSSPGFLALLGFALLIVCPAFQDLDVAILCAAVALIILAILILLADVIETARMKRKKIEKPQPAAGGYSPEDGRKTSA
jgi:hypothetical protein